MGLCFGVALKPTERRTEEEGGKRKAKERENAAVVEDGGRARGDRSVRGRDEAAG